VTGSVDDDVTLDDDEDDEVVADVSMATDHASSSFDHAYSSLVSMATADRASSSALSSSPLTVTVELPPPPSAIFA